MKIKQILERNENLDNYFINFCLRSKPFDFCCLSSKTLRMTKINEYLDVLYETCKIFIVYKNNKILTSVFISEQPDHLIVEFVFGNAIDFTSKEAIDGFHKILKFAQEKFQKYYTISVIEREFKKNKYITWIKRYDKKCEICYEDPKEIKISWKYERLC
jgi:hypothetical protein